MYLHVFPITIITINLTAASLIHITENYNISIKLKCKIRNMYMELGYYLYNKKYYTKTEKITASKPDIKVKSMLELRVNEYT